MMKRPNAPFLDLSFYFANVPDADAFARLVKAALRLGAKFTGECYVQRGIGIRDKQFESTTDEPSELMTIDMPTLTRALTDPDIRVVEVYMHDAVGLAGDADEIVTYIRISPKAANVDRHPLAIWTDGGLFSGLLPETLSRQALNAGRQAYDRFLAYIAAMRPSYGAITGDAFPLMCPTDLRDDPLSAGFRDFFVSETYLGASNLLTVRRLFSGAYIEEAGEGVYVSCTKEFNPERRSLDIRYDDHRSVEVANLIASVDLQRRAGGQPG